MRWSWKAWAAGAALVAGAGAALADYTDGVIKIGVLNDQVLYTCKYMIPTGKWKHGAKLRGKPTVIWGRTVSMKKQSTPLKLRETALKACRVVGKGLYGVDVKEVDGEFVVVEVNDNPNLEHGIEDTVGKDEIWIRLLKWFTDRFEQ